MPDGGSASRYADRMRRASCGPTASSARSCRSRPTSATRTSTRRAVQGADAVINCVGILNETGRQTFAAVVDDGAARVARIAAEEGVGRLVHISAIGADRESDSLYARAKAEAERRIGEVFPGAVILRPSIVFGEGDGFFNRFASMARMMPGPADHRRGHALPAGLCR